MGLYNNVMLDESAWVSPRAGICGDVRVGPHVVLLAGAQLRGDDGQHIEIGAESNLQENVVVHVGRDHPTVVGARVTVGHGAILHGCTLEDDVLVGMGAIVMDGARIRTGSVVGAGALVTSGKDFPENSLILGNPAKAMRTLSPEEAKRMIQAAAQEYQAVARRMQADGYLLRGAEAQRLCAAPAGENG